MTELPPEARRAVGLLPGETLASSWPAAHQRPGAPSGSEGFLVVTSNRLLFLQEAGGRLSKSYQPVPGLSWPLATLGEVRVEENRGRMSSTSWLLVQGEYFSVGKGGAQENSRARWFLEQARSRAARPPPSSPAPVTLGTLAPVAPSPPPQSVPSAPSVPLQRPPTAPNVVAAVSATAGAPAQPSFVREPTPHAALSEPPRAESAHGLSVPGFPTWPMVPITIVETPEPSKFWSIVGSSGVERDKMLVFCTESPGELSASYGLAGATLWRIASSEGEGKVKPGDVDRLGLLIEDHFAQASGQAVVLKGLDRIIEEAGFRGARRLLEVAREVAEKTRGAVIVHVDPILVGPKEIHQLEEDGKVLKL